MPIIRQHRINRFELKANRHALYLFGDNLERTGMGGQAGEMRGEPNAVGVATKRSPGMTDECFFSDVDFAVIAASIARDLEPAERHCAKGGVVIVPLDGLGTGLSQLPERAPRVLAWLETRLYIMSRRDSRELPLIHRQKRK